MIPELITLIAAPILRSVAGWMENALEDGMVSKFEWAQLGSTVLRVGMVGAGLYYGLDFSAMAAAGSSVVLDILFKALRKSE